MKARATISLILVSLIVMIFSVATAEIKPPAEVNQVDGCVILGTYEQWNNYVEGLEFVENGKEPIEWIVLEQDGTKLFLPEYEAAIAAVIGDKDFAVIERDLSPVMVIHDDPSNRAFLSAQLKSLMQQYPRGQQLRDMIFLSKPLPRTATGKVRRWELP